MPRQGTSAHVWFQNYQQPVWSRHERDWEDKTISRPRISAYPSVQHDFSCSIWTTVWRNHWIWRHVRRLFENGLSKQNSLCSCGIARSLRAICVDYRKSFEHCSKPRAGSLNDSWSHFKRQQIFRQNSYKNRSQKSWYRPLKNELIVINDNMYIISCSRVLPHEENRNPNVVIVENLGSIRRFVVPRNTRRQESLYQYVSSGQYSCLLKGKKARATVGALLWVFCILSWNCKLSIWWHWSSWGRFALKVRRNKIHCETKGLVVGALLWTPGVDSPFS